MLSRETTIMDIDPGASSPRPHRHSLGRINAVPTPAPRGAPALSHEIQLPADAGHPGADTAPHGPCAHYLDAARHALLAKFDYGEAQMQASGFAWPIVEMRMKYVAPLERGLPVRIRATIVEWEHRLKIDYLIFCAHTGRRLHRASSIQVAMDRTSGRMCWVCPPVLWDRLGVSAPLQ